MPKQCKHAATFAECQFPDCACPEVIPKRFSKGGLLMPTAVAVAKRQHEMYEGTKHQKADPQRMAEVIKDQFGPALYPQMQGRAKRVIPIEPVQLAHEPTKFDAEILAIMLREAGARPALEWNSITESLRPTNALEVSVETLTKLADALNNLAP